MKLQFRNLCLVWGVIIVLAIPACVDKEDYDFDRLSMDVDWTPEVIMPMSYGTYSLKYLLNEYKPEGDPGQRMFFDEKDGLIHLKYKRDSVLKIDMSDVMKKAEGLLSLATNIWLPEKIDVPKFSKTEKYKDLKTVDRTIPVIGEENDIKLGAISLDLDMRFRIINTLGAPVEVTFEVLNAADSTGANVMKTLNVPMSTTITESEGWQNIRIDFNKPANKNKLALRFSGKVRNENAKAENTDENKILKVEYQVTKIKFRSVEGNFGTRTYDLPDHSIDLRVDLWDHVEGDYQFENPQLKLIAHNKIGLPFTVSAGGDGYNKKGEKVPLIVNSKIAPDWPKTAEDIEKGGIIDTISFDKNNSNLVDVLALPPSDKIVYNASIKFNNNVDGTVNKEMNNIVTDKSSIELGVELDVPMHLAASKLTISDTISDVEIKKKHTKKILSAALIIQTVNGCPLAGKFESIKFLDTDYGEVFTLKNDSIIDAAPIGTDGRVVPSDVKRIIHKINLSKENIDKLSRVKHILIEVVLNTTSGKAVKLLPEYEMNFNLMVEAKVRPSNV